MLDLCVALTERSDEDEQMRLVAKKVSLTQPAPIQIDSTEPEVIETALDQIPGRAIVNSVNLEAGRDKLDRVVPLALAHGAALIALTIDEVGMAKTAERKVEIAKRIRDLCCEEHGLDPELLIFDCLTFTLTTGDEEWRPSAVETIAGIKAIKEQIPHVKTSLGVSNVSFGVSPGARAVLNSTFLHHCVQAGLDLAMVNPNHITPYSEIPDVERELADDLVYNRREDALERFIEHFESKGEEEVQSAADPTEGMEPEEALHFHILRRRKEGVEDWIDKSVEKIGAVPTLNEVLLPAMKEVGDKFGAGELILPFVLQSAEVMKRAVAQLEKYLDKIEGYTKGTVVLATVFGDVHDIGKSLVNTILTNNGYTVVDLGKQVPIQTILDAAVEHEATAIGLSALLVSTSKQMPAAIQELHAKNLDYPVLIGGAAINRAFSYRALYPGGKDSEEPYEPGVFYCKDAFEGLSVMDQLIDADAHAALLEKLRAGATAFRAKGEEPVEELNFADDSVRSAARTDVPIPTPPFWGVKEIPVDLDEVYPHLDTHVLFKLHWAGKGVKGEAWQTLLRDDFRPRLERMWKEQTYLHPRALLGFFPCYSAGNDIVVLDPEDRTTELTRFVCPRQPKGDRICLADFYRPAVDAAGEPSANGSPPAELDVIAVQAVTVGGEVTELMAKLEAEGEFAEQLFVHGLGVQTAEGLAEWLHLRGARDARHPRDAGPALLVGLPGGARAVRAPEGREAARPRRHRHEDHRRLRPRPRAVDARADRPPPAGDLLRHAPGPPAARRLARRRDQGLPPRPVAVRRARRRGPAGWSGRSRGRARAERLRRRSTPQRRSAAPLATPERPRRQRAQLHRRAGHRAQAHVLPGEALGDQRGDAHQHRRGELDDLQDDAVGERVGGGDVVGAGEHGHACRLEDADVGRGGGDHRGDVDGEQHRRGAGDPDAAVEAERHQQKPARHALQAPRPQLHGCRDRRLAGVAKHAQPFAHPHKREAQPGEQDPQAQRALAMIVRGARHDHGREQHQRSTAASGASATASSAP